jgi:hypothetical protein
MVYKTQNSYAPSAQTLVSDVKHVIEHKFPRLEQDIINEAINHSVTKYNIYIGHNKSVSEQDAEAFFFNSVMERIGDHNRRQHDALIAFTIAHHRYQSNDYLTPNSDLSSGFLTLNSHQQAKIFEENHKKFRPLPIRFPASNDTRRLETTPFFLRGDRIDRFKSLNNTLQKQVVKIDELTNYWMRLTDIDLKIQIFDKIYYLAKQNLYAIALEREIILSINNILENSDIHPRDKRCFMHLLGATINNERNTEILIALRNQIVV